MFEIPTFMIEEAILQLLREKRRVKSEKGELDPLTKQELLVSINVELNSMIDIYTERTGKTLDGFFSERREEIAKEREKTKIHYT